MDASRRDFLKKSSLALAGSVLFSNATLALGKKKQLLGIQLYSVRADMKKDPLGTLGVLAEIGYKHVEHANYVDRKFYGYSVTEFNKILNDLGMKMPSGHTVMRKEHWDEKTKDFTDAWKYTVEDAAAMGQHLVISPSMESSIRKDYDSLMRFLEVFNKCGELCAKSGMRFGYHNHDFEFSEMLKGEVLFDLIMNNTEPSLVSQQLDIGNMYNGGALAIDILNKYTGRFESLHVKDEVLSKEGHQKFESTILGAGIIPVKKVIDLARDNGALHFIVEQEAYQGKTPIACAKEDYEIMKAWGY